MIVLLIVGSVHAVDQGIFGRRDTAGDLLSGIVAATHVLLIRLSRPGGDAAPTVAGGSVEVLALYRVHSD